MFIVIGIIVVFGSVVAGYLMEHGNLLVLLQPAELLIIGGASIGTVLIANPPHILKQIGRGLLGTVRGSKFSQKRYLDLLKTLYELTTKARKDGMMAIEPDIEKPAGSAILNKNQALLKDHHALEFLCDSIRMSIAGFETFELDQILDLDIDVHHQDSSQPVNALTTMADALPGLGIVAAVLGVVITMGAIGGPPEEVGRKVAAALVGTFLGVLLCYGLVGPLAANLGKAAEEESAQLRVIRAMVIAYLKGSAPITAVEVARRAIPGHLRPPYKEVELACRNSRTVVGAPGAPGAAGAPAEPAAGAAGAAGAAPAAATPAAS
jgi:chemotaxis protein MotA